MADNGFHMPQITVWRESDSKCDRCCGGAMEIQYDWADLCSKDPDMARQVLKGMQEVLDGEGGGASGD